MEVNLKRYSEEEETLIRNLRNNDINYHDALNKCSELWLLVPKKTHINPILLKSLMYEKFHNEPDWDKNMIKYKLSI